MKYNDYSVDDFVTEESFQSYVLKLKQEDIVFWQNYLDQNPNLKEKTNQAASIIGAIAVHPVPVSEIFKSQDLARLTNSINRTHEPKVLYSPVVKWAMGMAASLLLIIGMVYIQSDLALPSSTVVAQVLLEKSNPRGQKSIVTLPDGSKVNLNAESSVKYVENEGRREIYLQGEAFFKVKKDASKPFVVYSGDISTTALGTSFNVRAYADDQFTQVYLVTGKVAIENKKKKSATKHILLPGNGMIYDKQEGELANVDLDEVELLAWKDGNLRFVNADFQLVRKELERWYGVKIEINKSPNTTWEINGSFKNQSINNVLQSIQYTTAFEYTIEDKTVKINF